MAKSVHFEDYSKTIFYFYYCQHPREKHAPKAFQFNLTGDAIENYPNSADFKAGQQLERTAYFHNQNIVTPNYVRNDLLVFIKMHSSFLFFPTVTTPRCMFRMARNYWAEAM